MLLLEGSPRIFAHYPEELSRKAEEQLRILGVEVHTQTRVTQVDSESIWIGDVRLPSTVTIWAAGVEASPLGKCFPRSTDRSGWPFHARLSGYPAWLAGLFIHLFFLAGYRNRASVFLSWGLTFLSRSQAAGLITEEPTGSNVDRH